MTGQVHCAALIGLLQQLAPMQGAFRDQGIVVFFTEASCPMESSCDDANGLELSAGITDGFFVDSECLSEELVADFFETGLVCDLPARYE